MKKLLQSEMNWKFIETLHSQ